MRRLILVVVALVLFEGAALAQKIGYVDLRKALDKTAAGVAAKARVKAVFDKKQAELRNKEDELRKLKLDYDKQLSLLKPAAAAAKEKEIMQRYVELQEVYVKLQREVSTKEVEMLKDIFAAAKKIIDEIAVRDGYVMIFEKTESSLLYAAPGIEITDEVILRMNGARAKAGSAPSTTPKPKVP
ncbi:MAG: OmpH family outer membrane protein [Deltaproteobacteria bacterium]|nr:OmpH family outer membrane protein [Deltaproteobacteria bacterium]